MSITKISPDLVDFDAGITISTADNLDTLTLTSTDADASFGPHLRMYRNSSSPADDDLLGDIEFEGRNDNSQDVVYGRLFSKISDASDGTEDGIMRFDIMKAGSLSDVLTITPDELVINDGSYDYDFRVESNTNANRFIIDAGTDKILIGNTTTRSLSGISSVLSVEGTGYNSSSLTLVANSADSNGAYVMVGKSRGSSVGSSTALQNGDQIGGLYFNAADGTDMNHAAAYVSARIYGDVSGNDIPGLLQFATTPDGSNSPTEKLAILPSGGITFNGDRSTANALDDYEEGTWTPTIGTGTFSTSDAYYVKVGRFVKLSFRANTFSDNSTNTSIAIGGLPYPVESNQALGSVMGIQTDNTDADTSYANTSETLYFYSLSSGSWDAMTHADINNSSADFYVQGSYRTT